jgi:SAM-dependent methyltransferase
MLFKNLKKILNNKLLKLISKINQFNDYAALLNLKDNDLLELHKKLKIIRIKSKNYNSYDYGNFYYYQSFKKIQISGFRNTEERIQKLNIENIIKNKSILDIGSNSGFLLLSIANDIRDGYGIDINPYLVETSNTVKSYLNIDNVNFVSSPFESMEFGEKKFEVVLSLANHDTFDMNTKYSLDEYFKKINNLLFNGGILIFESHPESYEPKIKLEKCISIIEKYFYITDKPNIEMSTFMDKNRSYLIAEKKTII